MNLKAIMFAGLGLTISVGGTSWWVGNDMADIRARQKAKIQRCEQLRAQLGGTAPAAATGAGSLDPVTGQPEPAGAVTTAAPAASATGAPADPALAAELASCPEPEKSSSSSTSSQAGAGVTAPAPGSDPYAATEDGSAYPGAYDDGSAGGSSTGAVAGTTDPGSGYVDPATAGSTDPNAGGYTDPNAGGYTDPNAGGYTDPNAGGYTDSNAGGYTDPGSTYADANGQPTSS